MPYGAVKTNIAESLNVLVHIKRQMGVRVVSEVLEIRGYDGETGSYRLETKWIADGNALAITGHQPSTTPPRQLVEELPEFG